MRYRTTLTALGLLTAIAALALAGGAVAADGGNSANAKLCQQGGWETLTRSDGSSFANTGACVSYAARGGEFGEPDPPGPTWTLVVSACTPEAGFTCVDVAGSGLEPGSTVTLFRDNVQTQTSLVSAEGTLSITNSMTECSSGSYTFHATGIAAGGAPVTSDGFQTSCGS